MTATPTELDLSALTDKRITITFVPKDETEPVTQEGKVEQGSPVGLVFKEKGKANVQLIPADNIREVSELPTRESKVTQKALLPVAVGRVRQHLADRHGMSLTDANALSEADAEKRHNEIDHKDLAHRHEVPKAQADAEAGDSPIENDDPLGEDGGSEPDSDD